MVACCTSRNGLEQGGAGIEWRHEDHEIRMHGKGIVPCWAWEKYKGIKRNWDIDVGYAAENVD